MMAFQLLHMNLHDLAFVESFIQSFCRLYDLRDIRSVLTVERLVRVYVAVVRSEIMFQLLF